MSGERVHLDLQRAVVPGVAQPLGDVPEHAAPAVPDRRRTPRAGAGLARRGANVLDGLLRVGADPALGRAALGQSLLYIHIHTQIASLDQHQKILPAGWL
jgi:hypothetical protein